MDDKDLVVIEKEGKEMEVSFRQYDLFYSLSGWKLKEKKEGVFIPPSIPSTHVDEPDNPPLTPQQMDAVLTTNGAERALDEEPESKFEGHDFK